ncbi:MAG: hypothetical protein ACK40S_10580, partial [Burkholderiaceae bacterium]
LWLIALQSPHFRATHRNQRSLEFYTGFAPTGNSPPKFLTPPQPTTTPPQQPNIPSNTRPLQQREANYNTIQTLH